MLVFREHFAYMYYMNDPLTNKEFYKFSITFGVAGLELNIIPGKIIWFIE